MSKITIEIKEIYKTGPLHILPEEIEKTAQILLSTLILFQNIGWEDQLEIIKASISKTGLKPKIDFYLSVIPPIASRLQIKPDELKIFCSWTDPSPFFFVGKGDLNNHSPLQNISLKDNEVKTIASALMEAVGIVIDDQIKNGDEIRSWLTSSRRALRPKKL